jgi:predicted RNase H-like nuclease (RuvC/YqgF family)
MLQELDSDVKIELEPIQIDGNEYQVDGITSFVDGEGDKETLVLGVTCKEAEDTSDDADSNIDTETESEETPVETIDQVDEDEDTADDDGDAEVLESLKEMIRQKEALETELSDLRKAKSVGDAKEQELQEKLDRYRAAFRNTSAEAAKVPELQEKVKELTEKLTQSTVTIKTLTEKINNARQLKESVESGKATEKRLTEEVSRLVKKSETLEAKLEGQAKAYTEKLQERTNLAKAYKARFIETLTRYVESKASMLGVQPSEITSRLNENYTLADVDAVCDQILDSTVNFGRLPFGGRTKTSARIAESVSKPVRKDPEYGYDIDDSLLELAGLKK